MKGLGGSNPRISAKQSAIFAFSAEKSKILRMFATFDRFQGVAASVDAYGCCLWIEVWLKHTSCWAGCALLFSRE